MQTSGSWQKGIDNSPRQRWPLVVLACVLLLGVMTVFWQQQGLGPMRTHNIGEMKRHRAVIEYTAPTPWRYRLLSEWIVAGGLEVTKRLGIPNRDSIVFFGFRIAQNIAIFFAAYWLYRLLGLSRAVTLVALTIVGWVFSHSQFFSGTSYNTYTDILAYLIAGICVIEGWVWWLLPLTCVATLNRETAAMIPLLGLWHPFVKREFGWSENRKAYAVAGLGLAVWAATYGLIRYYIVPPDTSLASYAEIWKLPAPPGWRLLLYHLTHINTLYHVSQTLSLLPILALLFYQKAPPILRAWFAMVVPVWFATMYAVAFVQETRLLAVPIVLILVPMALCGIEGHSHADRPVAGEVMRMTRVHPKPFGMDEAEWDALVDRALHRPSAEPEDQKPRAETFT